MTLSELGMCPPAQGSYPLPQPGAQWGGAEAGPRIPRIGAGAPLGKGYVPALCPRRPKPTLAIPT